MILSAISDSSRPDHINQGLWESCCKALGWGGSEQGWLQDWGSELTLFQSRCPGPVLEPTLLRLSVGVSRLNVLN